MSKSNSNNIFKNMLILATGAGFAQLINFASMPIITRIYSPSDIGLLSLFVAIVSSIVPLTSLRYNTPIPLIKNNRLAVNLLTLSFIFILFFTTLVTIILSIFSTTILNLFSANSLIQYWYFIPITIFFISIYELINSFALGNKKFKEISKSNTIQALLGGLTKIGLGLIGLKPLGLIIGTLVTNFTGAIYLLKTQLHCIQNNTKYISKSKMYFLFNRFHEFPKYRLPSQFLLIFSKQIPLFFLAFLYTPEYVGYFALTTLTLSVPFTLFGNTTGQAYYAEIAKIGSNNSQRVYDLTKNVLKKLFLFGLIPFIIILFLSPALFSFVFGEKWIVSGEFASILSFYTLAAFISSPLVHTLNIYKNQIKFLFLNILRLIVNCIVFIISWIFSFSIYETIITYSIGMSIYFLFMTFYIFRTIKSHIKD
ncbi:lipopolysaccharide biosynthesis protein [Arcobacter cloacae]|uniref:lipopolysaccharide biosynthesis protein n=1 Tax=Arcobacter cloacae TaxID=1054034 RepID=UPI001009EB1C|nr:oligosaccharide flippase family protein [Arcobacter cloacae]